MKLIGISVIGILGLAALPASAQTAAPRAPRVAPARAAPTRINVLAQSSRALGHNCFYQSQVAGSVETPTGSTPATLLRNVDLRTHATITCDGRVAGTRDERVQAPSQSFEGLNNLVVKDIAVNMPGGPCIYSSSLRLTAGQVEPGGDVALCEALGTADPAAPPRAAPTGNVIRPATR